MRSTTRIALAVLAGIVILTSCKNEEEKVVATWPDGSPQIVHQLRGKKENAVKVAERRYYENGKLQCEKHYTEDGMNAQGQWQFYYDNGQLFAQGNFDSQHPLGDSWQFRTRDGADYTDGVDSLKVAELGDAENPATVFFYRDSTITLRQFYSTGALRSQGEIVAGQREGVWVFYFANGSKQTEATFVNGKEEGTYTVYRENGVPYYRGQYRDGKRTGTWELYDEAANLVSTQEYN